MKSVHLDQKIFQENLHRAEKTERVSIVAKRFDPVENIKGTLRLKKLLKSW